MKKIEKKKLITWISIGVALVAVVFLCISIALRNKDKVNSGGQGDSVESIENNGSSIDDNLENPSVELEDDSFENETGNNVSGNDTSVNNEGSGNSNQGGEDTGVEDNQGASDTFDNSGAIVLPEVPIP